MRNFDETRWQPAGSRPHLIVPVSPAVADLAAAYLDHARRWWAERDDRPFNEVFQPTARPYLHLTLAWLDQPTSQLPHTAIGAIEAALRERLRDVTPILASVGPGTVGYYAMELYVDPDPALDRLAATARAALRDVFGADAVAEPAGPWCPHIAVLYGRQQTDTDGLASRIMYNPPPGRTHLPRPITMPVDQVLVVDQDTWGPTGLTWNRDTQRHVICGGES